MTSQSYKYHPYIDEYIDGIRAGKVAASEELKLVPDYIDKRLGHDWVRIDSEKINKAVAMCEKYFDLTLLPWQRFIFALVHCFDSRDETVIFSEFFIEMGRGNGKNGFISMLIWYLMTATHGVKEYNIDIVANSEEQAETSFFDVYNLIRDDKFNVLQAQFENKKSLIRNKNTGSTLKFNTSNARTKDGKRSACLVFDELHEYENFSLINVFTSSFGKRKHSRIFYITTNGHIRGGVLDEMLDLSRDVLMGKISDIALLPLIYKIDSKEEVHNEANWHKANPSLMYFPELLKVMRSEYAKMQHMQSVAIEFMTKRMNLPAQDTFTTVASVEQVKATNRPIPYDLLKGRACIGGIDYSSVRDFTSVGLLFKMEGCFYLIEHTFVCHKALEPGAKEIKFPVREMEERGLITVVNEDTIKASYVVNWFLKMASLYDIRDIRTDDYRRALLESSFQEVGLPLTSVRSGPITHARLSPLIDTIFAENNLVCGDNPTMRWYINNVKQEMDGKGNITYLKIEPQTRKTDGYFMFLHALTGESLLPSDNVDFWSMKPIF